MNVQTVKLPLLKDIIKTINKIEKQALI